jgi:uncharacterized protein (DUF952 family)
VSRIFHIATAADWAAAQRSGSYTTSTLGRTLAEEGFIHASHADQWQGVRTMFYADVRDPLVLLAIDPDKLTAPVVEEVPDGAVRAFPHIYGPLNTDAVVRAIPLDERGEPVGSGESFSRIFFHEMFHNVLLACVVLAGLVIGSLVGRAVDGDWGALIGAAAGLVGGVAAAVSLHRRRDSGH